MRRPVPLRLAVSLATPSLALALGACGADAQTAQDSPRIAPAPPQAGDSYFLRTQADFAQRLAVQPNTNRAKNVILFIGDGMGISTQTAGRIYQGQAAGEDGESFVTAMDSLPWAGLVKTYTHNAQTSDSAATATAIMAGVKAQNYTVGVTQEVAFGDCPASFGREAVSVFAAAATAGLSTGIVTTTSITHATPAAAYAHTPNRLWEADSRMPPAARQAGCIDIARQLVEWPYGDGLDVALGGGRAFFLPDDMPDPEHADTTGARADGRHLAQEWADARPGRAWVWNSDGLEALSEDTQQVLGLFQPNFMQYESRRTSDPGGEPSLKEMTRVAIEWLSRNAEGFILLVEGGMIDQAHHAGMAGEALNETMMFDEAVAVALDMTDPDETLILVTADHSHGLTISGDAPRGNPILGMPRNAIGTLGTGRDGLPYTTLSYATGPGGTVGPRADVRADANDEDTFDLSWRQPSLVPMPVAVHSGEDVAVRSIGPWAHLLSGTVEQNYLYHVMVHALGLTPAERQ